LARRVLKVNPDGSEEYDIPTRFWYDDGRFPFRIADGEPPPRRRVDETDEEWRRRVDEWKATRPTISTREEYLRRLKRRGYRIIAEGD